MWTESQSLWPWCLAPLTQHQAPEAVRVGAAVGASLLKAASRPAVYLDCLPCVCPLLMAPGRLPIRLCVCAAVDVRVRVLVWTCVFSSLGHAPKGETAGSWGQVSPTL